MTHRKFQVHDFAERTSVRKSRPPPGLNNAEAVQKGARGERTPLVYVIIQRAHRRQASACIQGKHSDEHGTTV